MILTPRQIALVESTFALLKPKATVAALAFYQRLFALDPALRALFHHDIEAQAEKLMAMLGLATQMLEQPAMLEPLLLQLGQRHVNYGVQPAHYATVGSALLWSLQATLGDAFTPEARQAWTALYVWMAEAMQGRSGPSSAGARIGGGADQRFSRAREER